MLKKVCASGLLLAFAGVVFASDFDWKLPTWAPIPVVPVDNPMTKEKVELGRHLFYDKRLSADNTMSCATCHDQKKAFTDGKSVAKGITGEKGARSSMPLANVAYLPMLTWVNPNLTSLEAQALVPIFGEHPVEMGMAGKEALLFDRLGSDKKYVELFSKAFPSEAKLGNEKLFSLETVTKALASFERSILSFDSAYDRYKYGVDEKALSPSAKRGETLFFGEKLECYHCHGGFNFTDNVKHTKLPLTEVGFHNTGLYNLNGRGAYPKVNPGLMQFTGKSEDEGKFRTPSLRNVALTAPYMHDGSISSLNKVIKDHYAVSGRAAKTKQGASPLRSSFIGGFQISPTEVSDLVEFLKSLTDEKFISNPNLSNPWE